MRFKLQTWFFIAFCLTSIGSKFQALSFPSRAVCGAVAVWFSKSRRQNCRGHVVITRGWLRLCHTEQYVIQSSGWCSTAFSCINLASRLSWEKKTFQECAWPFLFVASRLDVGLWFTAPAASAFNLAAFDKHPRHSHFDHSCDMIFGTEFSPAHFDHVIHRRGLLCLSEILRDF